MVSDLRYKRHCQSAFHPYLLIATLQQCIPILGSFLFLLSRAWFAGVEEKSARCCCWARQPRTVAIGAWERHKGENVRRSAVDGAFMVMCGLM